MADAPEESPIQAAVKLHQAGKISAAAAAYQRILDSKPDDAQALHLLGVTFVQIAQPAKAIELIGRAIELLPNVPTFHLNLAGAYLAGQRIDDAIAESEKAIALGPNAAGPGYHVAGLAFLEAGQFEDAAFCFQKEIEADVDSIEGKLLLAIALDRMGQADEGAGIFGQAREQALARVAREPANGMARLLLGRIHQQAGKMDEAIAEYRAATRLLPEDPIVFFRLGQVLQYQGKRDEALTCYQLALRISPTYADAHIAVGAILDRQHRPAEAIESFRTALSLFPNHAVAQGHLAAALTHCGRIDEAIEAGRAAVALKPQSPSIYSTLLLTLHYSPKITPVQLFGEHLEWAVRHADALAESIEPHQNSRDPEKLLRVGFMSGDFRSHPVAKFILPVFEHHDRNRFAFLCYSDTETNDDVTKKIQAACDGWRRVVSWSDARLARQIRDDEVDILVDLSGHTGEDRLLTLARKAAPIQITHFGYPDTTGLRTVDYRMTDALADPPGQTEQLYTEKLARLPRAAWCYRPYELLPRLEARGGKDPVTFGSVNNIAKLSPDTLATWAKLLDAAAEARLVVLATSRDVDGTSRMLIDHGIDATRLMVLARAPSARYMDLFNQFDIALDPFPYNGGVTTCDALWMGCPVIALAGQTYVSRQGVSLLTHVGLGELVAASTDDYVRIGAELAGDRDRLVHLRGRLREMMTKSPICDYAGYTAELQVFYRSSWREYCGRPPAAD